LKVRSESGRLVDQAETVSTDFVRDAAVGLQSVPDSEILDAAFRILARRMAKGSVLTSPKDTQRYLTLRFAELEHEVFAILYLTLCGAAVYAKTLHYSAALA
jgi:DNA repair protein RadC